jgi:hypothetical protein
MDFMNDQVIELTDTVVHLDTELTKAKDIIAAHRWDATDIEVDWIHDLVCELREQVRIQEIEIQALTDSRNMFQERNADLIRQLKALKKKK